MRDSSIPLFERIEIAIKRITSGSGSLMRIPVEATDPDVVLGECKVELARLTAQVAELQGKLAEIAQAFGALNIADPSNLAKAVGDYINGLRAELEAARRDAARLYEWAEALRNYNDTPNGEAMLAVVTEIINFATRRKANSAIDERREG